jgi:molybdopterin converting factor small subunit
MKNKKMISLVIYAIILMVIGSITVSATSVELELPIQTSLDKINKSTDTVLKAKVLELTKSLITSQEQIKSWDLKIIDIHSTNDQALVRLQQKIKEIDVVKIEQLATDLEKTKDRYRPVFTAYNPLSTLLGSKIKVATAAIQLARADIELKTSKLKNAKDHKANTVRLIKSTLSQIDAYKVQLKAAKSNISLQKTRMTAAGKSFNSAIKNADMKAGLDYLTTMAALSKQMVEQKQKIQETEKVISSIIIKAQDQVPA